MNIQFTIVKLTNKGCTRHALRITKTQYSLVSLRMSYHESKYQRAKHFQMATKPHYLLLQRTKVGQQVYDVVNNCDIATMYAEYMSNQNQKLPKSIGSSQTIIKQQPQRKEGGKDDGTIERSFLLLVFLVFSVIYTVRD